MNLPIQGSCLCGGSRFELLSRPLFMSTCHCSRCRKVGGCTTVAVLAEHFRWVRGEELVERHRPEAPDHLVRAFCRRCGSYLGEPDLSAKGFPVAASALDDDPGVRQAFHEHVASKAPWYEITDDLPRFAEHPPW